MAIDGRSLRYNLIFVRAGLHTQVYVGLEVGVCFNAIFSVVLLETLDLWYVLTA